MEQQLEEIVREIEEEQALNRVSGVEVFRSMLNQPNLVAISSANATGTTSGTSFSKFSVNLPRPVLQTESIQLVNANIPQCVQNIPDTAATFWYYRLSEYSGKVPNSRNLYYVKLLPSYYKKEFIAESQNYGYNQTFNSYQDVATQLALACQNDLTYDNLQIQDGDEDATTYRLNYLPSEISITYNAGINKFQMTGTNATTQMAYKSYNAGTTYALNDVVIYLTSTYISLQAGNTGNTPATSPLFWRKIYVDIVETWDADTPYRAGQYVAYNDTLYIAVVDVIGGGTPDTNADWSTTLPTDIFYRYLITGFNDPNVQLVQGTGRQQWNPYALFELNDIVEYNGGSWYAIKQNKGFIPFTINGATIWNVADSYDPGDFVLYNGVVYECLTPSVADQPDISPVYWTDMTWNNTADYQTGDVVEYLGSQYRAVKDVITKLDGNGLPIPNPVPLNNPAQWVPLPWDATRRYAVGDIVSTGGVFYIATQPSTNQAPALFSAYWSPNTYWTYIPFQNVAPVIGLNRISSEFDMLDIWDGVVQYPFPVGIPGQPFNPNPRRLLNSILGFTWNGLMNAAILDEIDTFTTAVSTSTTTTELFNRLRPVPQYFIRYTTTYPILRDPVATASQTYTADGYCNLVYSSIISIYATIVGGSTLDTQENTNLLAMGTMNCGNLGVSFFSPYVNNPLKVAEDIYTLQIELQDEFGEPYVLTNNAVATFVLKITYKKEVEK